MKRIYYPVAIFIIAIFTIAGYCNSDQSKTESNKAQTEGKTTIARSEKKNIESPKLKMYTNDRMKITFQYPESWVKYGEESNAINRNGEVMSIKVSLTDTITHSIFYLEYHLPPNGAEIYNLEQKANATQKDTKQVMVGDKQTIEYFMTKTSDIKGNTYDPALRIAHVFFLDKLQSGEFDLRLQTPLPGSDAEIAKFNQLLSSIKFTS